MIQPRIIVHLGASKVPERFLECSLHWVKKAVEEGYKVAKEGASAEDIVASTVSVLEDCPVSDAGIGSVFNAEKGFQMDAGLMTGDLRYGAVLSLKGIQNPIKVARMMVDDPKFSILCGEGAIEFARRKGVKILPNEVFVTEYNTYVDEKYGHRRDPIDLFVEPPDHGTVGCVAIDVNGRIAAGTSTGGTPFAPKGRVSDSAFPGCGVYANSNDGGVSCTGYGEAILVERLAACTAENMKHETAMNAAKKAILNFAKSPRHVGGVITIKKSTGEYGLFHNTEHMPYAMLLDNGTIKAGTSFK